MGLLAAPEHTGGTRLQGQGGGVGGDVGAALVDNSDDTHGYRRLFHHDAAGALHPLENSTHRVREGGHLPDALGHACDALRAEGQPVQHDLGDGAAGGLQVGLVGGQNGLLMLHQRVSHSQQSVIFCLGVGQRHSPLGSAGLFQQFQCRHRTTSFDSLSGPKQPDFIPKSDDKM